MKTKTTPSPEKRSKIENVLVMQGGGSLGAYECGVYKTLAKNNIKFDIIAGTSIGAINAAILVGSKNNDPAKDLENFWLNISEKVTPDFLPEKLRMLYSTMYSAFWGNPRAFEPIMKPYQGFLSAIMPYLYSTKPFKKTLENYIDFAKINKNNSIRMLVTSVDIQSSKVIVFDSKYTTIDVEHVLASAGFPFYGIAWMQKDGKYLWDGSLMSNTPLREVIKASPKNDKNVYLVSLFPRVHEELPANMAESWHRARDIMHTDKIEHNIRMSKIISRHLKIMKSMYKIILDSQLSGELKKRFEEIEPEYNKLACERGAIIQKLIKIERHEESHFLFEDADFSIKTIKKLINQGSTDAQKALNKE